MTRHIITDETTELLEFIEKEDQCGLVHIDKTIYPEWRKITTVVFNRREAQEAEALLHKWNRRSDD